MIPRNRAEACRSKRKHTEKRARQVAAILTRRTLYPAQAYECPFGGHWHVAHAQTSVTRSIMEDLAAQRRAKIEARSQPVARKGARA